MFQKKNIVKHVTCVSSDAVTDVTVTSVHARSGVLTGGALTFIDVRLTMDSGEARFTSTVVTVDLIRAGAVVTR